MLARNVFPALQMASRVFKRTDSLRNRGGWKRWLKLALRSVAHRRHLQPLWSVLDEPRNRWLVERDPYLPLRSVRPYLSSTFGVADRTAALMDHLDWLHGTLPAAALRSIHGREPHEPGLELWSHGAGGDGLSLHLTAAFGCYREAELAVQMRLGGRTLIHVGFTVLRPERIRGYAGSGADVVLVGACQGTKDAADEIRRATRLAEGLRPRALALVAVQAFSRATAADAPLLVGSTAHVLSSYRRTLGKRVAVDYDAMWPSLGACPLQGPWWVLPEVPGERPIETVPSNKRAAYRRRSALRQAAFKGCLQTLRAHFIEPVAAEKRPVPAALPSRRSAATATAAAPRLADDHCAITSASAGGL